MLVLIVLIVFVPSIFAFPLVMCWVEERLYEVTPVRAALPLVPTPAPVSPRAGDAVPAAHASPIAHRPGCATAARRPDSIPAASWRPISRSPTRAVAHR